MGEHTSLLGVVKGNAYGHGLASQRDISVVGIDSDWANIQEMIEHHFGRALLPNLREALEVVRRELPPHNQAACSAAAPLFRGIVFTFARVHISMYWHWPSRENRMLCSLEHRCDGVNPRLAITWMTLVGQ